MTPLGALIPSLRASADRRRSTELVERLAATECPAFTARRARRAERIGARYDPIVWVRAEGANVVDADGNVYVDLTSGFGAAAIGHRHPAVIEAITRQSSRLVHALGDLHPSDVKIELLERLAALAPFPDARVVLSLSGADAVETALKTAALATGRPSVVAFEGGYHGLSHGPLATCGYAEGFRAPFAAQLNPHVTFLPFPEPGASLAEAVRAVERAWPATDPGALVVEPIQGRGGVRLPPEGFLSALSERCRSRGVVCIVDEIFTGLGRTGSIWRCATDTMTPDLICAGKALGGTLPVSACLGRLDVMRAWGDPDREAIHTGTFFGHPLGCATALATLDVIEREGLADRARVLGDSLRDRLDGLAGHSHVRAIRGAGLMIGLALDAPGRALELVQRLLDRGYLALPAGHDADVLQITPPLTIAEPLLERFIETLGALLEENAGRNA